MLPQCKYSTSSCEIKLRELEIDSYSKILSVFRARGNISNERRKLLKQIGTFLNISQDRHRAEVRRVTNDELLSNIATRLTGQDWTIDWYEEGKRLTPTPTPFSNFTVNTPFADYISSVASLGKQYVDLYNQRFCDSVMPNQDKSEVLQNNSGKSSGNWLDDVNKLFESIQKDKLKDVSIQTIRKKIIPKECSYCQRRKEMRRKKLELNAQLKPETAVEAVDIKAESYSCDVLLPSGKKIIVENAFDDLTSDLSVSIIAQEIVVETEPCAGPSRDGKESVGASAPSISITSPDFSGVIIESDKIDLTDNLDSPSIQNLFTNVWDESEKSMQPRIPRILNSGPRKKLRKQPLHSPIKHPLSVERGIRKKVVEGSKEATIRETACILVGSQQAQVRYPRPPQPVAPGSRQGPPRQQTTGSRPNEGLSVSQESSVKHQVNVMRHHEGVSKHHVRIRHTQKASRPYPEVSRPPITHHSTLQRISLGEAVEIPIQYSHKRSEFLEGGPVEVVEINSYPMDSSEISLDFSDHQSTREAVAIRSIDNQIHERHSENIASSMNFLSSESPETLVDGIIIPTSHCSTLNNMEGRSLNRREDYPSRKIIKIYNGEKKVHGTIHFHSDRMKDMINKLPNTQVTQMEVKNGCQQAEENINVIQAQAHPVWDAANISSGDFIMEDVSIVEECSYPLVNGHEEVMLEEEVLSGSDLMETLVDKSEVCVIPQTDMKFSVVDLTNYTGPIENLHSVSSQSKDDSRDSDIILNRP